METSRLDAGRAKPGRYCASAIYCWNRTTASAKNSPATVGMMTFAIQFVKCMIPFRKFMSLTASHH